MKIFFKYISHFAYVAINWNIWMAFFMIYDNIRGSIRYGPGTFAPVELKNLTVVKGDVKTASRYEAVSFYMVEKLFRAFRKIASATSIVDLGCGKGRAMMVAAHFGFTDIKGIDFAKEICAQATVTMTRKEKEFSAMRWQVLNADVTDYEIKSTDSVFFMFNPFGQSVLKNFLLKLEASCHLFPRTIYFLYASPRFRQLLLNNGYAIIYQKKKLYLESIIAVRDYD